MLTVQKHVVTSSRDWKSQLYLSRYAHSSLQKRGLEMTCAQQCQHRRFRVNILLYMRRGGRTAGKRKQSLSFPLIYPATSLPVTLGALSEHVELKKEANSSYLIDKLSQINSMWVDRVPMRPCRRWETKKTATWDGAAALTATPSTAQLYSHSTRPSLSEQRRLTEAGLAGVWN